MGVGVQVAEWLNTEYPQSDLRGHHSAVGSLAEKHCDIIRQSGVEDMGEVLVQLGSRLEKERWEKELFVGPWEVANKVSELLMKDLMSSDNSVLSRNSAEWDGVLSVDLSDAFDKFAFVQRLLDKRVCDAELSHVMALAAGFTYDTRAGRWDGDTSGVESRFLRESVRTGRISDIGKLLETPGIMDWLVATLGIDEDNDPNGRKIDQLNTYISTVHGAQITAIQKKNGDAAFRRLEVIAMWLHLYGGF